jgi:MFS family permease
VAGGGPSVAGGGGSIAFITRAFRYRNYRLFFGGQIVSHVGSWRYKKAMSWLVFQLTGSALLLGVIGFSSQVPSFLLTPVAGIFVDRWNRHRLLVATQAASMTISFILAALTLTQAITIPWLIAVSVLQGVVNAFDMPGRQTFVVSLIEDKADLGNAIALNSSMFNAARLVGPSVAGAIIALANEGWCFLIDGFSYLSVIAALLAMKVPPQPVLATHATPVRQFREGWQYAYGSRPILSVIALIALVCFAGAPYVTLMPLFAGEILRGGAYTLGFLMTAAGGGALLGALWLASRATTTIGELSRNIVVAGAIFSFGLVGFAFSTREWLSLVLMVVVGFGLIVQIASSNTLVQTVVEDAKRGRVMSFFLMAYFGTTPFGSLAAGAISARIGAPLTLAIGGALCLAGVIAFAFRLPLMPEGPGDRYVDRSQTIPASTSTIAAARDAE